MLDAIKDIPKIELHRHIEGCVSTETIIKLAKKNKIPLPTFDKEELNKFVTLSKPMKSLNEVLSMFQIAQSVFVNYAAIEEIVFELLEKAYTSENIRLLELRYSPDFMLKNKNLDWQITLDLINATIKNFERSKNGIFRTGIILIASALMA